MTRFDFAYWWFMVMAVSAFALFAPIESVRATFDPFRVKVELVFVFARWVFIVYLCELCIQWMTDRWVVNDESLRARLGGLCDGAVFALATAVICC